MKSRTYKRMIIVSVLAMSVVMPSAAQETAPVGVGVEKVRMKRNAQLMSVGMELGLKSLELEGNRAAVFTPVLVNGQDSVALPPVGVYSRTRWYQYLRAGMPLGGEDESSIRYSERPEVMEYHADVPYEEWMNGSELLLRRRDYGCCRLGIGEQTLPVGGYREVVYTPEFRYVRPVASGVKHRELSGRAYIDFPVNRTEIYPEYRKNPVELQKIIGTIDSIRNDSDITVSSITIKGYASPEGSYTNNIRLAKGRTATLKQYVENMYRFDADFIKTDYEPEDWAGLRRYVEGSGLEHRAEILEIIDSGMEPDPKNTKLQRSYPEEYRFLLQTVYPGLRHSDYTIEYTIRAYADVNEIAALLRTAPQKLSLEEMYRLAQTYEPGSDEWDEVFETAVRMYPGDETANLNAANAAMGRRDLKGAEKYLSQAGNSAEAEYARGVLKGLQGDFEGAKAKVKEAQALGMEDTGRILEHISQAQSFAQTEGTDEQAGTPEETPAGDPAGNGE